MSLHRAPVTLSLFTLMVVSFLGCDTRSTRHDDQADQAADLPPNMDMALLDDDLDQSTTGADTGVTLSDAQMDSTDSDLDSSFSSNLDSDVQDMTATDMVSASDLSIADPDANAPDEDASVADMMMVINDAGADSDMMTTAGPQVCNPDNMGQCECSNQAGFTTYTWEVAGQQRCFTVYTPESEVPLPVIVQMNCYAQNSLRAGGCTTDSGLVEAANTFGFIAVCASATDGDWTFGNDGVSNDTLPTPCTEEDSKDITYLSGLLGVLEQLGTEQVVDSSRIYTSGFSQNSMFAAYAAICFPDNISGVWQGGSGLFVAGETNPLPQMEGVCRRSDFLQHGPSCADITPCEECQYFPAYPVATTTPRRACVMAYEDDFLFPTARPMYDRLALEGHDATLLSFPNVGRGHSSPLQEWEWVVSCLEISEACTSACSNGLVGCMAEGMDSTDPPTDPGPHPCGDNVCDQVEQNNPRLCPRDCEERPADYDWCGDGLCDALERHRSSCPSDCGSSPNPENLEALVERYNRCRSETTECTTSCAATREMLSTVEAPVIEEVQP